MAYSKAMRRTSLRKKSTKNLTKPRQQVSQFGRLPWEVVTHGLLPFLSFGQRTRLAAASKRLRGIVQDSWRTERVHVTLRPQTATGGCSKASKVFPAFALYRLRHPAVSSVALIGLFIVAALKGGARLDSLELASSETIAFTAALLSSSSLDADLGQARFDHAFFSPAYDVARLTGLSTLALTIACRDVLLQRVLLSWIQSSSSLRNLTLDLDHWSLTAEDLLTIAPRLTSLDLRHSRGAVLESFLAASPPLPGLRSLALRRWPRPEDGVRTPPKLHIRDLAALAPNVETLRLNFPLQGLGCVVSLPRLRTVGLDVSNCGDLVEVYPSLFFSSLSSPTLASVKEVSVESLRLGLEDPFAFLALLPNLCSFSTTRDYNYPRSLDSQIPARLELLVKRLPKLESLRLHLPVYYDLGEKLGLLTRLRDAAPRLRRVALLGFGRTRDGDYRNFDDCKSVPGNASQEATQRAELAKFLGSGRRWELELHESGHDCRLRSIIASPCALL